jgi:hypothetical protein
VRQAPLRGFLVLALALAVGLASAVSPFASSSPDGLEHVAGEKGFLADGSLHPLQQTAPLPDYAFPGIDEPRLATGVAGFTGTLAVALLALGLGRLLARRRGRDPAPGAGT